MNINKLFNIEQKVVVITGGLGQLGTQYVKTLLEAGAKVAVFDVKTNKLNSFFSANKNNPNLMLCKVDITKKNLIKKGLKQVAKKLGNPSILINNAALDAPPSASTGENGPFEDYSEKLLDKNYQVNLKGMIMSSQVIGKAIADNGGGSIINISSIYGKVSPDQRIYEYRGKGKKSFFKPVSYSVTKGAVASLTRYLATYWAGKNVRVNTLTLGGVFNNQDRQFLKEYCKRVPLNRMANEDEYNAAILFLASKASSYMTGSNLIIDGGLTAW